MKAADAEVARLSVRVQPSASRNELTACSEGVFRLKIAAPPVAGRANRELLSFLSGLLGVRPGDLAITTGHTSRRKVVAVTGLSQEVAEARLLARLKTS